MNVFSEREQKVIDIIGRKKLTYTDIGVELYKNQSKPLDCTITVGNCVSRIIKKCTYYKLDWTLTKRRENKRLYIKKEKK